MSERTANHPMSDAASAYLDALRALGANLVVVSHILALFFGVKGVFHLGSLGVTIFFLLSGFLIMQSMLNRARTPGPHLPAFLADRAARILTPYLPALVLIACIDGMFIEGRYGSPDGLNSGVIAFLGNALLLQDHSVFQLLASANIELPWRIRPYNSAEPFWTVAIEMWIYVCMGLFFFCMLRGERLRRGYFGALLLLSAPVLIWNAAAGGGKCLSLTWLLGAAAGLLFALWKRTEYANQRTVGLAMIAFGFLGLVGRARKVGFDPYDFQTAVLIALVLFGALAYVMHARPRMSRVSRYSEFLASYSYSLYLIHNTVLILILEKFHSHARWVQVLVALLAAHAMAYLLYLLFERHYRAVGRRLRPRLERIFIRSPSPIADAAASKLPELLPTLQPSRSE